MLKELIKDGKICDLKDGRYEIYSREAVTGAAGGEKAMAGDWIKVDSKGCPYPNDQAYFEKITDISKEILLNSFPSRCKLGMRS